MSELLDMFSNEVNELNVLKTEAEHMKTTILQMQRERITAEVNKTLAEEHDHSPEFLQLQSRQPQQQQLQQRVLREAQTKHSKSTNLFEENKNRPTSRQSRHEDSVSDRDSYISTPSLTAHTNTTTSSTSTTTTVNTKGIQNKHRPRSSNKRGNSANSRASKLWATLRQTREDMIEDKVEQVKSKYDAQPWLTELKKSEQRQMQIKEHLANLERSTTRQLAFFSSRTNDVYSMRDILQIDKCEENKLLELLSQNSKQLQESEAAKASLQSGVISSIIDTSYSNESNYDSIEDYSNLIINPVEFANNYNRKLFEAFGYQPLIDNKIRNYMDSSITPLEPTHLQNELQQREEVQEEIMCFTDNMNDKLSELSHKLITHRAGGETFPLTPSWLAASSTNHWWPAVASETHENNKLSCFFDGNQNIEEQSKEINAIKKEKLFTSNQLPSIAHATEAPYNATRNTSADNVTHLQSNKSSVNMSNGNYSPNFEKNTQADSHTLLPHIKSHIVSSRFAASSPVRVLKSELVKQENKNTRSSVKKDKSRRTQINMSKTKAAKIVTSESSSSSMMMSEKEHFHYGIQCSIPSWEVQLRTCVDNETSFVVRFTNCNPHQLRMKLHGSTHPWVEYECTRFAPVAGNEKKMRVHSSNNNKLFVVNDEIKMKTDINAKNNSAPFPNSSSSPSPSSSSHASALSSLASEAALSTVCCGGYVEVTITFEPHNLLEPSFDTELQIGVTREVNKLQNSEESSVWHFVTVNVHCETIMPNFTLTPCTEQEIEEFIREEGDEEYNDDDDYNNEMCGHKNGNETKGCNFTECDVHCHYALPEPDISAEYYPHHILPTLEHEEHFDQISNNNNNKNDKESIDCLFPFTFVTASRTKYFTLQNIGSNALVNVMCTSSSSSSSSFSNATNESTSEQVSEFVTFPPPLRETLLPQGDVMRIKITFAPLSPGPVKGSLHVIVREESHGKVLCEYCFNLFGVGIVPGVEIKQLGCVLQNEDNINEKSDHGVINDFHNCNIKFCEQLKDDNGLENAQAANTNIVEINNRKQWLLLANSKKEQILPQHEHTSAFPTEARERNHSSNTKTNASTFIKYYLPQTTPRVVSTLAVHVENATLVPLPCTWEIDGAKIIVEHLYRDYIDNYQELNLESVKQLEKYVHALVCIATSSSTCTIDCTNTITYTQIKDQVFLLPPNSISTFYFNVVPLTATPFMLACNLYLLQLPHSDSLPMHHARQVAPDIIALFKLANRRKYVLPNDVSMNSTTAIQELYRNDAFNYNDNDSDEQLKKQLLVEEYCTALQTPEEETKKEEQCKVDNHNETTKSKEKRGLFMTGFLLFAEPQLPRMTLTPARISWKEQDSSANKYVNGLLNKCLLHCPYVEPITLRNDSRLPLHFTFVPHKVIEEVEHVKTEGLEEGIADNFTVLEHKEAHHYHQQEYEKKEFEEKQEREELEVWFEPDNSVIAPLDTIVVYAHFTVHRQGEWSKRYDCYVSEVMEWIAPHLSCPHQMEINVVGVAAGIRVSTNKMFFGTVEEGETSSQELIIYNDNSMPVVIDILTHKENVKESEIEKTKLINEQNNNFDDEAIRILPSPTFTIRPKGIKTVCIARRGCMPVWNNSNNNIEEKENSPLPNKETGWCYQSPEPLFVQVRDGLTTMVETHLTVQRPLLFVEEATVHLGIVPRSIWQEVEFFIANPSMLDIPFTVCRSVINSAKSQITESNPEIHKYDSNNKDKYTGSDENVEVEIVTPECVIPAQTSHFAIKVNVRFTSFNANESYNKCNKDEHVNDECNVCYLSLHNHRYRDQIMPLKICCDVVEQLSVSMHLSKDDNYSTADINKEQVQHLLHLRMSEETNNEMKTQEKKQSTEEEKTSTINTEVVSIHRFVKVLLHNLVEGIIQNNQTMLEAINDNYDKDIIDMNANEHVCNNDEQLLMLPYCEESIANITLPDDLTVPFASHAQKLIISNWSGCNTWVNVQLTTYSTQCQSGENKETMKEENTFTNTNTESKTGSENLWIKKYVPQKLNRLHNDKHHNEEQKALHLPNKLVNVNHADSIYASHETKRSTEVNVCENIAPTFWTRMINGEEQRRQALHTKINTIINAFMEDGRGALSVLERVNRLEEEKKRNLNNRKELQINKVNHCKLINTFDLQPHGELQMRILLYCHLPGSYTEKLICQCTYLPNIQLPLCYHVFGKPIILHPSTLGLLRTPITKRTNQKQNINNNIFEMNDREISRSTCTMKETNDMLTLTLPAAIAEVSSAHRTVQLVNRLPRDVKVHLHIYPTPFSFEVAAVDSSVPASEVTLSLTSLNTATRETECNKFGHVAVMPSEMIIPAMHSAEVELSFCPHLQLFTNTATHKNEEHMPSNNANTKENEMHSKELVSHNECKEDWSQIMKHVHANKMWNGSLVVTSELAETTFNDAFLIDEFYTTHNTEFPTVREMSLVKVKPGVSAAPTITKEKNNNNKSVDVKSVNARVAPLTSSAGGCNTDALKPMQPFRTRVNGRVLRRNQIILPTVQERSILREWQLQKQNEAEKQIEHLQQHFNDEDNKNEKFSNSMCEEMEEENAMEHNKILSSTHCTNFYSSVNESDEFVISNLINEEQERVELMSYINKRRTELASDSKAHFVPLEIALRALCGLPHLTVESSYQSSDLCTSVSTITKHNQEEQHENYKKNSVLDVVEFEPILPGTASLSTFRLINQNMATLSFTLHLVEELHYHIHSTRVIHTSSNLDDEGSVPEYQELCNNDTFLSDNCNQADDDNDNINSVVYHLECNEILQVAVQVGVEEGDDDKVRCNNCKNVDHVQCKLQNEITDMLMVTFVNNNDSNDGNNDNTDRNTKCYDYVSGIINKKPMGKENITSEEKTELTQKIKLRCKVNPLRVWMTPHELVFDNPINANSTCHDSKERNWTHPNAILPALPVTPSSDISYPQHITLYNASREPVSFELVPILDHEAAEETRECNSTLTISQKLYIMQRTMKSSNIDKHDTCIQMHGDNNKNDCDDIYTSVIYSRDAVQHFILSNDGKGVIPPASAGGAPGKVQVTIYFKPYALLAYEMHYLFYVNNKPYKTRNSFYDAVINGSCLDKVHKTKEEEMVVLRLYGRSYDTEVETHIPKKKYFSDVNSSIK